MKRPSTRRVGRPRSSQNVRPLTDDLRRILRTELLKDTCFVTDAASRFSVHRRTLARNLRAEGGTFRQLANEVRFEIACALLAKTDLTLAQIAEVLNYTELSSFTRAFRRWSGQPPSEWRRRHRR